jgi:signal transduction histidine kinase
MATTAASARVISRPAVFRRRYLAAVLGIGAGATGVTVWVVSRSAVVTSPGATAVARGLVIGVYVVVGVYLWWRHPQGRTGPLLVTVAYLYALTLGNASSDPVWFALGMTTWVVCVSFLAYVFLTYPGARLGSRLELWFFRGVVLAFGVTWAANLVFSQWLPVGGPLSRCAGTCPKNGLQLIQTSSSTRDVLNAAFEAAVVVAVLGLSALIVGKARSPSRLRRRAIGPLSVVFVVAMVDFGLYVSVASGHPGTVGPLRALILVTLLAVPLAMVAGQRRASAFAAGSAGRLVSQAAGRVSPHRVESMLRDSLGDPTLELVLWASGRGAYVDVDGAPVSLPADRSGREVTRFTRDGQPVAAIVHDPGLEEQPEVLDGLTATSLMLLENARLVEELHASRARIVSAEERERLRLERDLHDGAQQRLMAIQIKLALARDLSANEDLAASLEEISVDATTAIAELRSLAHGIYPTVLRERGLADALEALSLQVPLAMRVADGGVGRCPPEIEGAVYFCAAEAIQNAVKHAGAGATMIVTLAHESGSLRFAFDDDGAGFDPSDASDGIGLVSMRDRIGAVGGEVEVRSARGAGTSIRGSVPVD